MQTRLIELHQQRGRLQERIAHQRDALRQQLEPAQRVFVLGARINRAARDGQAFVLRHPVAVTAAVLTVVVFQPRFVLRWTQRAWLAWRAWKTMRGLLPASLVNWLLGQR